MEIIDISTKNLVKAEYHFNPSLFRCNDKLWLCYRTNSGLVDAALHINELDVDTLQPIGKPVSLALSNPYNLKAIYEDPRVFWFGDRLLLAFEMICDGSNSQAQGLAELDKENFAVKSVWFFDYGKNEVAYMPAVDRSFNISNAVITVAPSIGFEKNWQFFEHAKELYFVYKIEQHEVVKVNLDTGKVSESYRSSKSVKWSYGEIRGGTPPILIGDRYLSFFHSSKFVTRGIKKLKQYHIGAYTFKKEAPFDILEISSTPILSGNLKDSKLVLWKNCVVFPCGDLYEDGIHLISYGHNDYCSKILKITHEEILKTLIPIK